MKFIIKASSCILLAITLQACSPSKSNEELLQDSLANITSENYNEAVINLKNILKNDPNHVMARQKLGEIYFISDNFEGADKELTRAVDLGAQNDAILFLAKTKFAQNQYDDTETLLTSNSFSDKNTNEANYYLGKTYLALGKIALAKDKLTELNASAAGSNQQMLLEALVLAEENKQEQAIEMSKMVTDKSPDFLEAWLLQGSLYSQTGQFQKSAEAYEEYFKFKPNNYGIRSLLAHNYIQAGNIEAAKPHVTELRKINDRHPTINVLAAQIAFFEQDYQVAKEIADQVAIDTNNGLAQMISGLSSFYLENYEQSYYQLNAISDALPSEHQVHKILSLLRVKLGYFDEYQSNLAGLDSLDAGDANLLANIGIEFANQGDTEQAIAHLNKAMLLSPNNTDIMAQMGVIKLLNDDKSGLEQLEQAISLTPEKKSANIALALSYIKEGNLEKAVVIADQWIESAPTNASAYLLRGNIAIKQNQLDDAYTYFQKAHKVEEDNIIPLFNIAVLEHLQEKYEASDITLDTIFAKTLDYPFSYRLAVNNAVKQQDLAPLETKLEALIKSSPEAVWPRIILAQKWVKDGQAKEAIELLDVVKQQDNLPTAFHSIYLHGLRAQKDIKEMEEFYNYWINSQVDSELPHLAYAYFLERKGDINGSLATIKKALTQPELKNSDQLKSLEAYYLLGSGQIEQASTVVKELVKRIPDNAFTQRLQGQLALKQGDFNSAIEHLGNSYDVKDDVATGLNLAVALKNANQTDKAIEFLEKELVRKPSVAQYKKYLTELYIQNSPSKAIVNYQEFVAKNPRDLISLNNLAWLLFQEKRTDEALQYAKKAKELAPRNASVLDTLGVILQEKGDYEEATSALKEAYEISPRDKEIVLHLAQAYRSAKMTGKLDSLINSLDAETKSYVEAKL